MPRVAALTLTVSVFQIEAMSDFVPSTANQFEKPSSAGDRNPGTGVRELSAKMTNGSRPKIRKNTIMAPQANHRPAPKSTGRDW